MCARVEFCKSSTIHGLILLGNYAAAIDRVWIEVRAAGRGCGKVTDPSMSARSRGYVAACGRMRLDAAG